MGQWRTARTVAGVRPRRHRTQRDRTMEPHDDMQALSADEALHSALCALALGELNGDEARALEARVASEPALAAQYDEVRATIALVRTSLAGTDALPPAHMERVLDGARAQAAP